MRTPPLLLSTFALVLLAGCATTRPPATSDLAERAAASAARARYRAIQAAQQAVPVTSEGELLPLTRPERTEDGIILHASTYHLRLPRTP